LIFDSRDKQDSEKVAAHRASNRKRHSD